MPKEAQNAVSRLSDSSDKSCSELLGAAQSRPEWVMNCSLRTGCLGSEEMWRDWCLDKGRGYNVMQIWESVGV